MLTCSNCGAAVREGAKFCTSCGTRLNDAIVSGSTNTWTTSDSPTTDETTVGTTANDSGSPGENAPVTVATPASEANEAATATPDGRTAASDNGFSWSWGSQTGSDSDQAAAADRVDEESASDVDDHGQEAETIVDATEIEILEEDHTTSDEEDAVTVSSGQEDPGAIAEDRSGDGSDTETLAAWAEQWDESADESQAAANTSTATDDAEDSSSRHPGEQGASGDDEDTVAKAERLLGELRALIPALIDPRPTPPSVPADTSMVADDLEGAARIGHFDDVRDTLLTARDDPRDVDNMLSLANKVDRLLELLDDRNNLAKTAENAASRLRSGAKSTLM